MHEEIARAARSIDANPLGRLMHGQRELFHSNLLAWFFDALPDAAEAVLMPLTRPGEQTQRSVDRERSNLDLLVRMPGRAPLVVENKVFSIPDLDQLRRYEAVVERWRSEPTFALLSTSAPDFDPEPWQRVDYRMLADAIAAALPRSSSYEVETMRRYVQLARDVQALVDAVVVRSDEEPVWMNRQTLAPIGSGQTRAALQKARAKHIVRRLRSVPLGSHWYVNADMTRGTPLVEAFARVVDDGVAVRLGVQLQGDQLRRAVIIDEPSARGRSEAHREMRTELARAHPAWFAMPAAADGARGGRSEFNHYAPDFVYRYAKAPSLTIARLIAAIAEVHDSIAHLEPRR